MRKQIGIYMYNRVESDQIIVSYNDNDPVSPTDRIIMLFVLRDSQVYSQGNINDSDYIEIYANAIKIFKGEITE